MSTVTRVVHNTPEADYTVSAVSALGHVFSRPVTATSKREAAIGMIAEIDRRGWRDKEYIITDIVPSSTIQEFNFKYEKEALHENILFDGKIK